MIPLDQIQFDPASHSYRLAGEAVPSVTQVLEAEGLSGCSFWKEEHRMRGTAVHRVALLVSRRPWVGATAEEVIANSSWDPSTTHPMIVGYGYGVARFMVDTGFRPELVEQPVASKKFRICGTLDQWGTMPSGAKRLVDFKSGNPQESAHVQTAIYDMCLAETMGYKTDERVAVWLRKDGTYKVVLPKMEPAIYMNAGQCAINLYRWRERFRMLG